MMSQYLKELDPFGLGRLCFFRETFAGIHKHIRGAFVQREIATLIAHPMGGNGI